MTLGVAVATTALGSILDSKQLSVDFTSPTNAAAGATWSDPDMLTVSKAGLGWDGEPAEIRDGWIQTKPLAVGLSWRPPVSVSVRIEIQPAPATIRLANGQESTPWQGNAFVRYSPDRRHWSTWQALETEPATKPGRCYKGVVAVPARQRAPYAALLGEYSKLDVPWKSDEEAAVKWILGNAPDFFEKQLPFIGYLEFLFEAPFYGGQRITSLQANVSYGMSGLHSAPKDKSAYAGRDNTPWRFVDQRPFAFVLSLTQHGAQFAVGQPIIAEVRLTNSTAQAQVYRGGFGDKTSTYGCQVELACADGQTRAAEAVALPAFRNYNDIAIPPGESVLIGQWDLASLQYRVGTVSLPEASTPFREFTKPGKYRLRWSDGSMQPEHGRSDWLTFQISHDSLSPKK